MSKERFAISSPGSSRAPPGPRQSAEAPPTKHSCSQYCPRISKVIQSTKTSKILFENICKGFIGNSKQNTLNPRAVVIGTGIDGTGKLVHFGRTVTAQCVHCSVFPLGCSSLDASLKVPWKYMYRHVFTFYTFPPSSNNPEDCHKHCMQVCNVCKFSQQLAPLALSQGIALFSSSVGIFFSQSHIKEVSTSC